MQTAKEMGMKTGFGVFVIGLMLIIVGLIDVNADFVDAIAVSSGVFLAYVGTKLMRGNGSLVDNPTLW